MNFSRRAKSSARAFSSQGMESSNEVSGRGPAGPSRRSSWSSGSDSTRLRSAWSSRPSLQVGLWKSVRASSYFKYGESGSMVLPFLSHWSPNCTHSQDRSGSVKPLATL